MNRIKKLFARSYVDIYQLKDPKDGAHLVELNFPDNTMYKGNKFNKANISMIQKLMRTALETEADCIYVGYLIDLDKFIAFSSDLKHNGILFRIDGNEGIVERKLTSNVAGLSRKFDYLVPIFTNYKENKV